MDKIIEARVSISTDPRVSNIGRYVVDVRNMTNNSGRKLATRITDDPDAFITRLTTTASARDITVIKVDNTGE